MTLTREQQQQQPPQQRTEQRVCADCSSPAVGWASVNRCVLLCSDCAFVHRMLGRHVSDVKALADADWIDCRLRLVYELSASGANSVWEHALLDCRKAAAKSAKEPTPQDSVALRDKFIRAKYESLAFVNRPSDDGQEELSQQLHASCRTANLKVSLRLLAAGADPNFVSVPLLPFPLLPLHSC